MFLNIKFKDGVEIMQLVKTLSAEALDKLKKHPAVEAVRYYTDKK